MQTCTVTFSEIHLLTCRLVQKAVMMRWMMKRKMTMRLRMRMKMKRTSLHPKRPR